MTDEDKKGREDRVDLYWTLSISVVRSKRRMPCRTWMEVALMRKSHVPTVDVDEEEKKVGNRRSNSQHTHILCYRHVVPTLAASTMFLRAASVSAHPRVSRKENHKYD